MNKDQQKPAVYSKTDSSPLNLSNAEWKELLPPQVYHIAREKGTERAWSSPLEHIKDVGTYYCAVCGNPLLKATPSLKVAVAGQVFMSR